MQEDNKNNNNQSNSDGGNSTNNVQTNNLPPVRNMRTIVTESYDPKKVKKQT